jgi:para-nitrobenzyl esterase
MAVPSAQPYFQQMISESGGGDRYNKREEAERIAEGFATLWRSMGNETRDLLTAPAAQLMAAQSKFMADWPKHFPLRAEVDGKLLPRIPVETIAAGCTRGKRLLIGTCRDESASFIGTHPALDPTAANLGNMQIEPFLAVYRKYKELYPQLSDEQRRIRALSAEEYWVPSMRVTDAHLAGGGSAYVYRVDFAETTGSFTQLAPHGQELKLVWNRPNANVGNAADEARLASALHAAWVTFLKGEAPHAKGLPVWPEFTAKTRAAMIVDTESHMEEHFGVRELALWEKML